MPAVTKELPAPYHQEALREMGNGIRSELPIAIGVVPFGMIFGVIAIGAGIPPLLAQAMSFIVFAGSAQFIGAQLIGAATPGAVILLTTFIINARHLLYSASMAPYFRSLSPVWRTVLAYLLTDEAYAVTILDFRRNTYKRVARHWFLLGAGLTLWSAWQASTAVGVFLGAQVPATWGLDFTLALTFIGIVVAALHNHADLAAALTAGIVALLTISLPYQLDLILASLAGIGAGFALERWLAKTTPTRIPRAIPPHSSEGDRT